jgi:hypothetical protein
MNRQSARWRGQGEGFGAFTPRISIILEALQKASGRERKVFPVSPPAEGKFNLREPIWHETAHWGVEIESAAAVAVENYLQE